MFHLKITIFCGETRIFDMLENTEMASYLPRVAYNPISFSPLILYQFFFLSYKSRVLFHVWIRRGNLKRMNEMHFEKLHAKGLFYDLTLLIPSQSTCSYEYNYTLLRRTYVQLLTDGYDIAHGFCYCNAQTEYFMSRSTVMQASGRRS